MSDVEVDPVDVERARRKLADFLREVYGPGSPGYEDGEAVANLVAAIDAQSKQT